MKKQYMKISDIRFLLCFFTCFSFISLLICSKCSFIYPFNDWYDANILFTLGKALMNGRIPYVDLVDQKGPYPYLLYGVAYLISHKSFLGLFILECISLSLFLFVISRSVKLYTKNGYLFLYPIVSFVTVSSSGFVHGGSIEEFSLPLIAYSVYVSLKLVRQKELKLWELLLSGFLAGILFWSKFTLCGCFLAFSVVVIAVCLKEKKIKRLFAYAGLFIAGCITASVPWFVFFYARKSVNAFLNSYLISNTFDYTNNVEMSLIERLFLIVKVSLKFYLKKGNLFLTFCVFAGIVAFMFLSRKKVSIFEKISCLLIFLAVNLSVFFSGDAHGYYGLVSAAFLLFFILSVTIIIDDKEKISDILKNPLPVFLAIAAGVLLSFLISDNTYLLKYKKSDIPQYEFAEIINKYEDKSLLNYKFMDGGFYTVLGTVPETKEYCTLNRNYNGIVEIQKKYLAEKKTNFVVTWYEFPIEDDNEIRGKFPEVSENYEMVKSDIYLIESGYRTYSLWIKKEN